MNLRQALCPRPRLRRGADEEMKAARPRADGAEREERKRTPRVRALARDGKGRPEEKERRALAPHLRRTASAMQDSRGHDLLRTFPPPVFVLVPPPLGHVWTERQRILCGAHARAHGLLRHR